MSPTTVVAETVSPVTQVASIRIEERVASSSSNKDIREKAKSFFKDDPILVEIARCESQFRQYNKEGNVLTGTVNKGDLGIMQINKYYHAETAEKLGMNLNTPEGNMSYAKYLYDREGTQPWSASSKCWTQAIQSDIASQVALK